MELTTPSVYKERHVYTQARLVWQWNGVQLVQSKEVQKYYGDKYSLKTSFRI